MANSKPLASARGFVVVAGNLNSIFVFATMRDMDKKTISIAGAIIVAFALVIGGGTYYLAKRGQGIQQPPTTTKNGVEGSGNFDVKAEPLPTPTSTPAASTVAKPNLDRQVTVSDKTVSQETGDAAKKKITDDIAILKKDSSRIDAWTELALNLRFIGEYQFAEEVLKYIIAVSPGYATADSNLAVLYQQNLKNYPAAEKYYLKYISLVPTDATGYINLSHMYRSQYLAKSDQADTILIQGLQKSPDNPQLLIELARYYRDTQKTASARTYYEKAIAAAQKTGNTAIVVSLQAELAALAQ